MTHRRLRFTLVLLSKTSLLLFVAWGIGFSATPAEAQVCDAGYYDVLGQCVSSCPDGNFPDPLTGLCSPCEATCATCYPDAGECTSCPPGIPLVGGACVTPCADGSYPVPGAGCQSCDATCGTCDGATPADCTSCTPPEVLLPDGTCGNTCVGGSYEDAGGVCQPCDSECGACDGPGTCTACPAGTSLIAGVCV